MQASGRVQTSLVRNQLLERRDKLEAALAGGDSSDYLKGLMQEVDAALGRLADGSFGLCEACHDSIEADRLVSDPLTRFCLDHLTTPERRALEHDLMLSGRIQSALLPPRRARFNGWEIAYEYHPAGVVSGDYCDTIPADGELFCIVGDVSGKGVPASILTAHLHATFRSLITMGMPLERMMAQANRLFCDSTMPNSFATLVCARASRAGGVAIANAGHCRPLVKSGTSVRTIEAGGLPLGLFCESQYGSETVQLAPGDELILYTDGLSEARNAAGAEYESARIAGVLENRQTVQECAEALVRDVAEFRGGAPQHDDLTVMVMRRTA